MIFIIRGQRMLESEEKLSFIIRNASDILDVFKVNNKKETLFHMSSLYTIELNTHELTSASPTPLAQSLVRSLVNTATWRNVKLHVKAPTMQKSNKIYTFQSFWINWHYINKKNLGLQRPKQACLEARPDEGINIIWNELSSFFEWQPYLEDCWSNVLMKSTVYTWLSCKK